MIHCTVFGFHKKITEFFPDGIFKFCTILGLVFEFNMEKRQNEVSVVVIKMIADTQASIVFHMSCRTSVYFFTLAKSAHI